VEERRKSARIPFSYSDAIYGILAKADSESDSVTLPISDISDHGGRFQLDLNAEREFAVGDKLLLKAIIGTRNIRFEEPIELVIIWEKEEKSNSWLGCEVTRVTEASKTSFIDLVRAEKVFRGDWIPNRKAGGKKKTGP